MQHYRPAAELYTAPNLAADLEALDRDWNPPPNPYANDSSGWIQSVPREELWSKQKEILDSLQNHRYTAVKSCHGPGKSFTASRAVAWWVATKEDPFVVTSAPTGHQVRTVLWREIQKAKNKAHIEGKITHGQVPEWKISDTLIGFGRKPADYLDPQTAASAFQGIHALNVLVVLDEGSGIPEWLAIACETLITNENSRLLVIGNPDNPTSWFAKCFRPSSNFNKITIKASDTPAFTGEPVSENLRDRLISKIWVEERRQRWGEQSPLYQSKVEANFPDVSDDTVFTPAIIEKGQLCDRSRSATVAKLANTRYGLDVARFGPDETVLYHNRAGYVRLSHRWAKLDTMRSVGEFRRATKDQPEGVPTATIDAAGVGAGVYDRLRELHYSVVPFDGGGKAFNEGKFKNRRSEAYWEAAELMEDGQVDIDPEDLDLAAELMEIHYKMTSTGQVQMESKEDISKRLGRSPDRADAFVMSLQKQADVTRALENKLVTPDEPSAKPQTEPKDLVGDLLDVEF